jgi:sugar phosphate isomerase/epimerase
VRTRAFERLEELIFFAAHMKARCVTIGGFRGRGAWLPYGKDPLGILADALARVCYNAESRDVRLAIEPLNRYETDILNTCEQTLAFTERIGSNALGVLLDTFHVNIEEPSLTGCFEQALNRGRLCHVHLGDSNRLPPGKGHLDFEAIVGVLRESGYRRYLSAELLPVPDPDTAAGQTAEHMLKLLH